MKTLYQVLYVARERSGLLPVQTVEEMAIFIDGYSTGNSKSKSKSVDAELEHFRGFQKWIQDNAQLGPRPWATIIRFWAVSNQSSLEKFYELLDEYRAENTEYL